MTTQTEQAIKPCPFCGYVGLDFSEGSTFRWLAAECGGCGATCGETRVQTMGEGTKDEWMQQAMKDAIEVWNTRALAAQQTTGSIVMDSYKQMVAMKDAAPQGDCNCADQLDCDGKCCIKAAPQDKSDNYLNGYCTGRTDLLKELAAPQCKYGNEPTSCTSSPMDCQCAIDAALAAPQGEPEKCPKCHGLGYYDEGHENDDGSMSGGNYVECNKCKPKNQFSPDWDQQLVLHERILELEKENFALAAGQCIHDDGLTGDDGGTPYCAIKRKLDTLVKKNPPVAYYDISHDEDGEVEYEFSVYPRKQFKPLYATIQPNPAPAPQGEPVAYMGVSKITGARIFNVYQPPEYIDKSWDVTPLYTHPAPAPLSESNLAEALTKANRIIQQLASDGDTKIKAARREGAEAMREACWRIAECHDSGNEASEVIRALEIEE